MMRRLLTALALVVLAFSTSAFIVTPEVTIVDPDADLQAAVYALDATVGGEIHVGTGTYTLASPPLILDRPVTLIGSGQFSTFIYSADVDSAIIRVTSPAVTIRDLCIKGANEAGTGVGLVLRSAVGGSVSQFVAERVYIEYTPSWGIALYGPGAYDTPNAGGQVVRPVFDHVTVYDNKSGGTLYSGHGVAAPVFRDCNFTGQAETVGPDNDATMADSLKAWKWYGAVPAYAHSTNVALHRGHVYLFATSAATFEGCIFQNLSTGANDEPMLSIEDCFSTRLVNSYFEAFDSTRAQPMVTMSAAGGFSFINTYARSAWAAPFRFLWTNSNTSSNCHGTILDFFGYQGDAVQRIPVAEKYEDFVFNSGTTAGDATGHGVVSIQNATVSFEDYTGSYKRQVDIRQSGGGTDFWGQNILRQNTSHRFRVPVISTDSLSALTNVNRGELVHVLGGGLTSGAIGKLFVGTDNTTFYPIPICPIVGDTTTRHVVYAGAGPKEGDLIYIAGTVHKMQVWDGTDWRDLH